VSYAQFVERFPQSILNRRSDSNSGKLWNIFAPQYEELQTILDAFKDLLYIYAQSGRTLDDIGTLVNETRRGGDSDETFRIFLAIAIAKKISRGTVPDMVEIGKLIPGEGGLGFMVDELWDKAGSVYFDGESLLDGTEPLDPGEARPASVLVELDGLIENLPTPLLLADAVDDIRAAGVFAKTTVSLRILSDLLTLYTTLPGPTLDGEGFFDGKTLMNERQTLAVYEIALGDGAVGDPDPGDIGLANELLRKPAEITDDGANRQYSIQVKASELNGVDIDELALFNVEGDMIAKVHFDPREKNGTIIYYFRVQETYN
jgi:hypothetical protein